MLIVDFQQGDLSTATPYNLDMLSNTTLFEGWCFTNWIPFKRYQETHILHIFQCVEVTHRSLNERPVESGKGDGEMVKTFVLLGDYGG